MQSRKKALPFTINGGGKGDLPDVKAILTGERHIPETDENFLIRRVKQLLGKHEHKHKHKFVHLSRAGQRREKMGRPLRLLHAHSVFFLCLFNWHSNSAAEAPWAGALPVWEHYVPCVRQPGRNATACDSSGDSVPSDSPTTPNSPEASWDLYARERVELNDLIQKSDCEHPQKDYVSWTMDVDLDGDQDLLIGFTCFKLDGENSEQQAQVREQLFYDEFWGWVADSYLAVMINDDGVFVNDQSVFGGEYPVYDHSLKGWDALTPEDFNGDGYPDVVIEHHWDNSLHNVINDRIMNRPLQNGDLSSGGSVVLSDGDGGYRVHVLPQQMTSSTPAVYTDELGDSYVWFTSNAPGMWTSVDRRAYESRVIDLEIKPFVGKITAGDLVDVTARYWEYTDLKDAQSNSNLHFCWLQLNRQTYYQNGSEAPLCSYERNRNVTDFWQVSFQGKVYGNASNHTFEAFAAREEAAEHCYRSHYQSSRFGGDQASFRKCLADELTNKPIMITTLEEYSMSSDRGVYVSNSAQTVGEWRYYILDPEVGFSKWDNVVYLLYLDMGEQWYLTTVGWGLTMEVQGSETMIMTNHSGALLDPGVELDDLDEFVNWSIQRTDRYNPQKYFTNTAAIYESIEAGFCPDFLALVEPEDCIDPAWMTQDRLERGDFADNVGGAEYGLSVGYRMSTDGAISLEPALTNLPMAFNPRRTHLMDFDLDGDLDIYLNDYNATCGGFCLLENTGDLAFKVSTDGIWGDADDLHQKRLRETCSGRRALLPSGVFDTKLGGACDITPSWDEERFLSPFPDPVWIKDIDNDGIWDFYTAKRFGWAEVIYGE